MWGISNSECFRRFGKVCGCWHSIFVVVVNFVLIIIYLKFLIFENALAMKLKFCSVCGKSEGNGNLEYHHFVPKSEGGSDDETNLLTLCFDCHGIIHGMFRKNISELTKKGLERAKALGKKLGSPNTRKGRIAATLAIKKNADDYAEKLREVIEEIIFVEKKNSLREIASELMLI